MPNLSELLYYNGETPTQLIVWSLFIGVVIAAIAGYLIKLKFGAFVRKLLENEIDSPEKAVTLEELGLQKKIFIKFSLRSHANYKNMIVAITEDGKFYANNSYTDEIPEFREFVVVKRKRGRDVIKETEKNTDESAPLSGLAKVLQSREKTATEKNEAEKALTDNIKAEKTTQAALSDTEKHEITETNTKTENEIAKTSSSNTNSSTETEESFNDSTPDNTDSESTKSYDQKYTDIPKERVKFDVTKARYFIPPEIHDRAYSLYHTKSSKANGAIVIIILLVALGLIATFSGTLISGFTDFLKGIKNPFSKPTL